MDHKFKPGDRAFLVESKRFIRAVTVMKFSGGLYTVRFMDSDGGMRVRESRLFPTREEAEASMPKEKKTSQPQWP